MSQIVSSFLEHSDAKLAKRFSKFSDDSDLSALLQRFDTSDSGSLDSKQAEMAAKVLGKMHTPSSKGFAAMVKVFDYLDVNKNQNLEHDELSLAVEILELFCKSDSVNDTLSLKEMGLLLDALEKLDSDGNGVLDEKERTALRDGLWNPDEFLESLLAKS